MHGHIYIYIYIYIYIDSENIVTTKVLFAALLYHSGTVHSA